MRLCVFSPLQADVFSSVDRLARTMLMKNTHTHTDDPNHTQHITALRLPHIEVLYA